MAKKWKMSKHQKAEACYGGRQPRIDTAEKQDGANNPRRIRPEDAPRHPGYDGK